MMDSSEKNSQKWILFFLITLIVVLAAISCFNVIIDPFFHFHGPLNSLEYRLDNERYENDGIQRHFDYEMMITGTSMVQNTTTSEVSKLWNLKAIKTAYQGATFHELSENMKRAIGYNSNLKVIITSLDSNRMNENYDSYAYDNYPDYLFDNNPFNDVYYFLNKDVLITSLKTLKYTLEGNTTTNMDDYGRFDNYLPTGREAVMSSFERMEISDLSQEFSTEDQEKVKNNVLLNYVNLAQEHPNVDFVFYIPPYSYCYWDALQRTNQIHYCIEVQKLAVKKLLQADNIHVYGFDDQTDITTNLDYYMDTLHYNREICDRIIKSIHDGEGELTLDNYEEYFDSIEQLYSEMEYW